MSPGQRRVPPCTPELDEDTHEDRGLRRHTPDHVRCLLDDASSVGKRVPAAQQLDGRRDLAARRQILYQHREELLQNLLWLAQTGEQTIPALLDGLRHENPKVRSSCAWVLGRVADRRTIPDLQQAMQDADPTVKMECARTLVLLGDLVWSPTLIEGLDSDRREVRYLCHEALKTATGHDFGYDHLNENKDQMLVSVLRWRQWWSEYSGDGFCAELPAEAQPAGAARPADGRDAAEGRGPGNGESAGEPGPGRRCEPDADRAHAGARRHGRHAAGDRSDASAGDGPRRRQLSTGTAAPGAHSRALGCRGDGSCRSGGFLARLQR